MEGAEREGRPQEKVGKARVRKRNVTSQLKKGREQEEGMKRIHKNKCRW